MKNEAVYIVEWIAHHLLIGFDEIIIFSNNSNDGTHELLDELSHCGFCKHFINTVSTQDFPQKSAYQLYDKLNLRRNNHTIMVLDVDEFLIVNVGTKKLSAICYYIPTNTNLMALNWVTYGSNGVDNWDKTLVTDSFRYRLPFKHPYNNGVKSLIFSPEKFGRLGNHSPVSFNSLSELNVIDGSGQNIHINMVNYKNLHKVLNNLPTKTPASKLAHINHYAIKTLDAFTYKSLIRGRGYSKKPRHTFDYFSKISKADIYDYSYEKYTPELINNIAKIRASGNVRSIEKQAQEHYRNILIELPLIC